MEMKREEIIEKYTKKINEIQEEFEAGENESGHIDRDDLLIDIVRLNYPELADLFQKQEDEEAFWYA